MPFFKKAEIRNLDEKYGFCNHKGIVSLEKIDKDEIIFKCDMHECMYYPWYGKQLEYTKDELEKLLEQYPDSRDYICTYMWTSNDEVYHIPKYFLSKVITDACAYFNHSCTPNVGFGDDFGTVHVALRDIKPDEEMTIHYGFLETEHSFDNGLSCKCHSSNCSKTLYFDFYKNPEFQDKYYRYCSGYVKSKIRKHRSNLENKL